MSFLEATINEIFYDSLEHPDGDITVSIVSATKLLLADMAKLEVTKPIRMLPKFQMVLALGRKELLDEGETPYQDIHALIIIRNTLIHYKPMWERGKETQTDKRIKHLEQSKRFPFNTLTTGRTNNFFPDLCLSHGCAEWAVEKSIELVTLFSSKMGTTLLFDANSSRFKTQP